MCHKSHICHHNDHITEDFLNKKIVWTFVCPLWLPFTLFISKTQRAGSNLFDKCLHEIS
jgi:hypothetical protein